MRGDILQGNWGMLTHNSHSFLCPQSGSKHLGPMCVHTSEETVHALHRLAAVVHAFGSDALAAGVVKPAVLGPSHRLAVQLALTDGHAVVEVDHRAHVFWKGDKPEKDGLIQKMVWNVHIFWTKTRLQLPELVQLLFEGTFFLHAREPNPLWAAVYFGSEFMATGHSEGP